MAEIHLLTNDLTKEIKQLTTQVDELKDAFKANAAKGVTRSGGAASGSVAGGGWTNLSSWSGNSSQTPARRQSSTFSESNVTNSYYGSEALRKNRAALDAFTFNGAGRSNGGGGGSGGGGGGGNNNGGVPGGTTGGGGNGGVPPPPFSGTPLPKPDAPFIAPEGGSSWNPMSMLNKGWSLGVDYGTEKMEKMGRIRAFADRSTWGFSSGANGGVISQRDLIRGQVFGTGASSQRARIAMSAEDAMSANWTMQRLSGSADTDSADPTVAALNRSFRASAAADPYSSATSAAQLTGDLSGVSMQRRAVMMGLGDTYRRGEYIGNARFIDNYLRRVYPGQGGQLTPEQFMRSMKPGQHAYTSFMTLTQGMGDQEREALRTQMEAQVKAGVNSSNINEWESDLNDFSGDDPEKAASAEKRMRSRWKMTDRFIQAAKDRRSVTDTKDSLTNEGFTDSVTSATKGLEKFDKALNHMLTTPPFKWFLEQSGGMATVNPSLQSAYSFGNVFSGGGLGSIMDAIPGMAGLGGLLGLGGVSMFGGQADTPGSAPSPSPGPSASPPPPQPPQSAAPKPPAPAPDTSANAKKPKEDADRKRPRKPKDKTAAKHASGAAAGGVIGVALAQQGKSYVYGGDGQAPPYPKGTPRVFDCSSLTQYAYWKGAGIDISRTTWTQMRDADGKDISPSQARPGDLIYSNSGGHVRMYLGPNKFVHAPQTGDVVRVVNGDPFRGAMKVRSFLKGNRDMGSVGKDIDSAKASDKAFTGNGSGADDSKMGGGTLSTTSVNGGPQVIGNGVSENAAMYGSIDELDALRMFFSMRGRGSGAIGDQLGKLGKSLADALPGTVDGQGPSDGDADTPATKSKDSRAITAPRPSGKTAARNMALGKQMAAKYGWGSGDQWDALAQLWQHESNWNHLADNPTSDAYGIPQALPGHKMGKGWRTSPEVQIAWGLRYIKGRYGNPIAAWKFWQNPTNSPKGASTHWYEQGAWDVPEDQPATVHQGEMIIPAKQAQPIRDVLLRESSAKNSTPENRTEAVTGRGAATSFSLQFGPGSVVMQLGPGSSPAMARTAAGEFFGEMQRLMRNQKIARGD